MLSDLGGGVEVTEDDLAPGTSLNRLHLLFRTLSFYIRTWWKTAAYPRWS